MIFTKQMAASEVHENKDLWETPPKIFNPLEAKFKFTLDPCCFAQNAKAEKFYTPNENGLLQSWEGETVFCNPPYSRYNIDDWMKKCMEESSHSRIVALIPVSTSSNWFHDFVLGKCHHEFIRGRIKFVGAKHTAPFSSMVCYYNFKAQQKLFA